MEQKGNWQHSNQYWENPSANVQGKQGKHWVDYSGWSINVTYFYFVLLRNVIFMPYASGFPCSLQMAIHVIHIFLWCRFVDGFVCIVAVQDVPEMNLKERQCGNKDKYCAQSFPCSWTLISCPTSMFSRKGLRGLISAFAALLNGVLSESFFSWIIKFLSDTLFLWQHGTLHRPLCCLSVPPAKQTALFRSHNVTARSTPTYWPMPMVPAVASFLLFDDAPQLNIIALHFSTSLVYYVVLRFMLCRCVTFYVLPTSYALLLCCLWGIMYVLYVQKKKRKNKWYVQWKQD